jgi:murein DD-endopeptidase MepM/ murein hydrolase activator NlpD
VTGVALAVLVALAGGLLGGLGGAVPPLGPAGPAGAQSQSDRDRIDEQIGSVRSQVQEASAEEARLLGAIDASAARKRDLDATVAELDGQLGVVQRNLNAAETKLAGIQAEQRATEARLGVAEAELAAAREALVAYAIAAYTGRTEAARIVDTMLRSHTIGELATKRSYIRAVSTNQTEIIAADERLRDEVSDLRDRLDANRREAESQVAVVEAERGRLQEARDAQAVARSAVAAELATTNQLRAEVVARKAEFEAEIEELQRQSAAIGELLRQRAAEEAARLAAQQQQAAGSGGAAPAPAAATTGPGAGGLLNPLPGAPITSPFGPRVHPIYGDARMHTGIDMGASTGTPIRSAGAGVVVSASVFGGYGNAIIIDHGGGIATLYAHQSSMGVSSGQRVTAGQIIGRVGCTGSCTGPHLHFEVRVNGNPVNPMPYIS